MLRFILYTKKAPDVSIGTYKQKMVEESCQNSKSISKLKIVASYTGVGKKSLFYDRKERTTKIYLRLKLKLWDTMLSR